MIPSSCDPLPFRRLGVVIPVFGHSRFAVEAMESACTQIVDVPLTVIVVDDGCPSHETRAAITAGRTRHKGKVLSLRQRNGGLSAARNLGVRTLLSLYDDLDAIFFLDADNRLEPYALQSYAIALAKTPSAGWAFPDVHAFGLSPFVEGLDIRETAAADTPFRHLRGNICEAGSLVRTEVFRQGVTYDEAMRDGLEDWDFWLSAREVGWHGVRVKDSGFLYRVRPESMVAQSRRQTEEILAGMRRKHVSLFSRRAVLASEHDEAPRLLMADLGTGSLRATSDPLLPGNALTLFKTRARFRTHLADPVECDFPDLVIAYDGLTNVDAWAPFWRSLLFEVLDRRTITPTLISLERGEAAIRAGDDPRRAESLLDSAEGVIAICPVTELYKLNHERPARPAASFLRDVERVERWMIPMRGGEPVPPAIDRSRRKSRLSALLRPLTRATPPARLSHASRLYRGPSARDTRMLVTDALCGFAHYPALPYVSGTANRCLFAVDPGVLVNPARLDAFAAFAAKLRDAGLTLALCLDGQTRRSDLDALIAASGAETVLLDPNAAPPEASFGYRGATLPVVNPASRLRLMALAHGHDVIACFGRTQFLPLCGEAKGDGIVTLVCYPEALSGMADDPVTVLAAYEQGHHCIATDGIAARRLALQGVPSQRMISLEKLPDMLQTLTARR